MLSEDTKNWGSIQKNDWTWTENIVYVWNVLVEPKTDITYPVNTARKEVEELLKGKRVQWHLEIYLKQYKFSEPGVTYIINLHRRLYYYKPTSVSNNFSNENLVSINALLIGNQ